MEKNEYIFIRALNDIEKKVLGGEKYNIVKAAGVLRQLLLDASPLAHLVNKTFRIKFEFIVVTLPERKCIHNELDVFLINRNSYPALVKTHEVNLSAFLKTNIISIKELNYSVNEIIDYICHVRSGIHSRSAKTDKELKLDTALNDELIANIFSEIAVIVYTGLSGLRLAIINKHRKTIPCHSELIQHFKADDNDEIKWVFNGKGHLSNCININMLKGFTLGLALNVHWQKDREKQYIYTIGESKDKYPRLEISIVDSCKLLIEIKLGEINSLYGEPLSLDNRDYLNKYFILLVEISENLTLTVRINNKKISSVNTGSYNILKWVGNKQIIAADITEKNCTASFKLREILVLNKELSNTDRKLIQDYMMPLCL